MVLSMNCTLYIGDSRIKDQEKSCIKIVDNVVGVND